MLQCFSLLNLFVPFATAKLDYKQAKTKFLSLKYFRRVGYNALIINTMKNSFL